MATQQEPTQADKTYHNEAIHHTDGIRRLNVYFFEQNNVASYETTSDAYQLINLGCSGSYTGKHKIDFSFGVNNLFNVEYIDHLSRLKPYEIPNPGRNFYVKVNLLLSKKKGN